MPVKQVSKVAKKTRTIMPAPGVVWMLQSRLLLLMWGELIGLPNCIQEKFRKIFKKIECDLNLIENQRSEKVRERSLQ